MKIQANEITRDQLQSLRSEAGSVGDDVMVTIVDRALDGDEIALAECARGLQAAIDADTDDDGGQS